MFWHNNLDSVYGRKPKSLPDAVNQYIEDSVDRSPGSRIIEDLQAKQNAQTKVLMAICTVLTSAQQVTVAQLLRLEAASNAE